MIYREGRRQPLAGRVALVTGVSRRAGIGFAIARRLAQDGADLFLHSWAPFDAAPPWGADPDGADVLAAELRDGGRRVEHLAADFRAAEASQQFVDAAIAAFGHVDILIATHAYSTLGTLERLRAGENDTHLAVNVRGTSLLIKDWAAQHDDMRAGGRVMLMTSGHHRSPMPGELAYVAAKGALHQLTASLAGHLAPRQITVNTIDPGATDMGHAAPSFFEAVLRQQPQGR
jgi:3-oxoacyl-[acyl-carrier protein] reductase